MAKNMFLFSMVSISFFLFFGVSTTHAAFVTTPLVPSQAATCDELIVQGRDDQLVPHPSVDSIFLFNIDTLSLVEQSGWTFADGAGFALCNAVEAPENDADDLPVGHYALVIVHQEGGSLTYQNCVNPADFGFVGFQTTVCFEGLFLFTIGNTLAGTNVVVEPSSDTTITFTAVNLSGETTVASSSSGPATPSGFKLGDPPTYYNISTTAIFSFSATVCIDYNDVGLVDEANLKLLHYQAGAWTDVTTSLNTTTNVICGQTTSFSPFALTEKVTVTYVYNEVKGFQLASGIEQGLLAKLDAVVQIGDKENAKNVLEAFINLINAQEGKKVSTEQAAVLIADTTALIGSL